MNIDQSLNELSISQRNTKKTKITPPTTTTTEVLMNEPLPNVASNIGQTHNELEHTDEIVTSDLRGYKSQYHKLSDKVFKKMLSQAIEDENQIVQSLDTPEKLQLIRQITELTHNVYYFGLQRDIWQDYYDIGFKNDNGWAPRLSKSLAKQLHTCVTYGYPKHTVEKRQRTIQRQIERTITDLNQHLTQLHTLTEQWQPRIDPNLISAAIDQYVKNGQKRLRQQFDYRRKMLECNSHDRYLITKFYALQPNEEQVC